MPTRPWSYYRWPIGLTLFLLIIMIASSWVMVIALRVNRDLVEDNPYERGLKHQEIIDQEKLIDKLGWKLELSTPVVDNERRLQVTLQDKEGRLIRGARVTVQALRPNAAALDENLELLERGDRYIAPIPQMSGLYVLRILIEYRGLRMRREQQRYL